jgi:hypothetical protein
VALARAGALLRLSRAHAALALLTLAHPRELEHRLLAALTTELKDALAFTLALALALTLALSLSAGLSLLSLLSLALALLTLTLSLTLLTGPHDRDALTVALALCAQDEAVHPSLPLALSTLLAALTVLLLLLLSPQRLPELP